MCIRDRYVEFSLYINFSTRRPDYKLLKSDTSFKSFAKFRKYDIAQDKWLYLTEKTTYFYAIGFNMARLLDKLKLEYKSRLFKEGQLSMEDMLNDKQKNGREHRSHKIAGFLVIFPVFSNQPRISKLMLFPFF